MPTKQNPHETRGRKRLTRYDEILEFIRTSTRRKRYGEVAFATKDPRNDAIQFRALTAFKELQTDLPGIVFTIFARQGDFLVVWEEGVR